MALKISGCLAKMIFQGSGYGWLAFISLALFEIKKPYPLSASSHAERSQHNRHVLTDEIQMDGNITNADIFTGKDKGKRPLIHYP
jgi:hypothetical protein